MYKHLTEYERYYISRRLSSGEAISDVAKALSVHKSTIYRELQRNKQQGQPYCHLKAIKLSEKRRSKAKNKFVQFTQHVRNYLYDKLKLGWSPEQISGRLLNQFKIQISFQTIYEYIKNDKAKGGKLFKLLPHRGKKYKYGYIPKTLIPNRIDITKRPRVINEKLRIGDFEGDTIIGTRNGSKSCLVTLVERKTKFTLIAKTLDKSASAIQKAIEFLYDNSIVPFKSITCDNGSEFCNHKIIEKNIGCKFYFARPYKASDRGLNEHTNGLIRRFFSKKTDFSTITNAEVFNVQNLLNNRPRKVLGFQTPLEVMNKHLNIIYSNPIVALHT